MPKKMRDPDWKKYRIPKDPNLAFVLFPPTYLTVSTVSVSLQGLLSQLAKHASDRKIIRIEYLPVGQKLIIELEALTELPKKEGV